MLLDTQIISVEGVVFEGQAHEVVVPVVSGEVGFMRDHESLVAELKEGEVVILDEKEAVVEKFAVKSGVVQMHQGERLVVLVD